LELFDEFITKKLKTVYIQTCIEDSNQQFKPWFELRRETEDYMKKNPFNDQIEKIKQQALDEFVTQTIYQQQIKTEKRPTDKAKAVLRTFIDNVKTTLKNDKQYIGQELKHFQILPELLRRIIIYYKCFLVQLPLYESADELLKKIQDNNVITISTSTGSGQ
jgi:HrpA-like RNA helicase